MLTTLTTGGIQCADAAAQILAPAFSNSVVVSYLLRTPELIWPAGKIPADVLLAHFQKNLREKVKWGAEISLSGTASQKEGGGCGDGDWAAAAVWFPPSKEIPVDPNASWEVQEYREKFGAVKTQHLQGRKYWYLNLIGRHPERTEPGAVRALFEPYFKKARGDGIPLWLEAISDHSRRLYEHLSFRTVAEVRLGVGRVNAMGEPDENGEGVLIYGMMAE